MKRYAFRLQPVLRLRRSEEDRARAALLAAVAQLGAEQDELTVRRDACVSRAPLPSGATTAQFLQEQAVRAALARSVGEQERRLRSADEQREVARLAWTRTSERVSALERLEERQRAEHRVEELREDDRTTDELVVSRYGRETA